MNDDQESPLIAAIRDAAYSNLNHLANLYRRTEDIGDCLPLMQPDSFRQIVANAVQELSEICLEAIEEIYEDFIQENSSAQTSSLRPSFRMMADLKKAIVGNTATLEREINHYESCYESFIERAGNYEEQSSSSAHNAATMGGVVGGVLFGPIGAILGGMAAGALADGSAEDELQEHIQKLCNHFSDVFDKVNEHLEGMAERSLNLIVTYNEQLEKHVSQRSLLG